MGLNAAWRVDSTGGSTGHAIFYVKVSPLSSEFGKTDNLKVR